MRWVIKLHPSALVLVIFQNSLWPASQKVGPPLDYTVDLHFYLSLSGDTATDLLQYYTDLYIVFVATLNFYLSLWLFTCFQTKTPSTPFNFSFSVLNNYSVQLIANRMISFMKKKGLSTHIVTQDTLLHLVNVFTFSTKLSFLGVIKV